MYLCFSVCCSCRITATRSLQWFQPSVFCLVKQGGKMLLHQPHHINQAWKHHGEQLTEGNRRQGQTAEILRSFIVAASLFSTLAVSWPISGSDPKTQEPLPDCGLYNPISLSRSLSLCPPSTPSSSVKGLISLRWSSLNMPDSFLLISTKLN